MNTVFQVYFIGLLVYGYFVFVFGVVVNDIRLEWLYTIPIWPLTLVALLVRVIWRGLKITFTRST